ncbi:MAG TPA: electron transfer flavoprotein subunit alpha/FixB family protein [Candidatus Limnocylindrales bacterium]
MILTLVEQTNGQPDRLSLETLALARRLGSGLGAPVHAVLFGTGARDAAADLGRHGVGVAHVVEHERLDAYAPAAWAAALAQLMSGAKVVLAAGSERGNEVMAHVGAQTGLPMAANCTDVSPRDSFGLVRQRWAGSLLEDARLDGDMRLLTVAPHAVAVEESAGPAATIETFRPELTDRDLRVRVVGRVEAEKGKISLADARVVVGGGRGVGGPEAFGILEELAGLLGAAVGVSRVATSAGWRPHSDQIGQTGLRIAPDLYIACGISGAIQHIVGCKAAKRILVINKDADAPIMGRAAYAVIGDLHTVVPAISAEIRRVRANGAAAGRG